MGTLYIHLTINIVVIPIFTSTEDMNIPCKTPADFNLSNGVAQQVTVALIVVFDKRARTTTTSVVLYHKMVPWSSPSSASGCRMEHSSSPARPAQLVTALVSLASSSHCVAQIISAITSYNHIVCLRYPSSNTINFLLFMRVQLL